MTSQTAGYSVSPFYLDAAAGRLFAVSFEPAGERRGQLLFCPPFAEELNKSRRMMNLAARHLAAAGHAVLIVDLYGTGDSSGGFEDARWETWISDLEYGVRWLARNRETKVDLCGIRLGANMALAVSERMPGRIDNLLLWQPLLSGKTHMTQFLRLKLAAQLTAPGPKTSTAELRAAADSGEVIEVAGYSLHPDLIVAIDEQDLRGLMAPKGASISWFEVVADEGRGLGISSSKLGDGWRAAGVDLQQAVVQGEQFWTSPEITLAPELIERTVSRVATAP